MERMNNRQRREVRGKRKKVRINDFQSHSEMTQGDKNKNRGLDWNGWRQMER